MQPSQESFPMYFSTRNPTVTVLKDARVAADTPPLNFVDAIIQGLGDDGGLLVPSFVPTVSENEVETLRTLGYRELCEHVMSKFIDPQVIPPKKLREIIHAAYATFRVKECVEITPIASSAVTAALEDGGPPIPSKDIPHVYWLELFHGPTFAFKDFALQFLGKLIEYLVESRNQKMTFVGATSGDTGGAAIAGFQGLENTNCVILYPLGRTSLTQELQMTTATNPNLLCLAVKDSTFDDCQAIVKQILSSKLSQDYNLGAVNSINWGRILAQIVYFWYGSLKISMTTHCTVDFAVPTGNFGNILAGYYAKKMGAPIGQLIIASNSNDIITRFVATGSHNPRPVVPTSSPAMDIQISSNLERLLFYVMEASERIILSGLVKPFAVKTETLARVRSEFQAFSASENQVKKTARIVFDKVQDSCVLDPHTAVGFVSALEYIRRSAVVSTGGKRSSPVVVLCTANFGKFPEFLDSVGLSEVSRQTIQIPEELERLRLLPQRKQTVNGSIEAICAALTDFLQCRGFVNVT